MRLVLVGATGRLGGYLLSEARAAGHHVTALARAMVEELTARRFSGSRVGICNQRSSAGIEP